MKEVLISNTTQPEVQTVKAQYCDSFKCRLRGLMFRKRIAFKEGLLLVQAKQNRLDAGIHMFAVFTDLAVIWLNNEQEVVDTVLARSWRPFYLPQQPARYILELAPERLNDFQVGDKLNFETHFAN
ncbi:MAG: hypothetical protein B6I38_04960 [Anaerolineaceae bacterium 4572_5.1]|nr:MAG: hypothetical protein B6I38_04960 [Anaerolineaceae bacterium 4572_5.1]